MLFRGTVVFLSFGFSLFAGEALDRALKLEESGDLRKARESFVQSLKQTPTTPSSATAMPNV